MAFTTLARLNAQQISVRGRALGGLPCLRERLQMWIKPALGKV